MSLQTESPVVFKLEPEEDVSAVFVIFKDGKEGGN